MDLVLFLLATLAAPADKDILVSSTLGNITILLSPEGEIKTATLLGATQRLKAHTNLTGCQRGDGVRLNRLQDGGIEFVRTWTNANDASCTQKDRFVPRQDSVRWEIEIVGADTPWSTEVETVLKWPRPNTASWWTAWSDPRRQNDGWNDPLVFEPFSNGRWHYAAPRFSEEKPRVGFCPLFGDTFCIPMATIADTTQDTALSIVCSPEDLLLDMELHATCDGQIAFSRINHRISNKNPLRFAMDLVAHPADWRAGLGWTVNRYPEFFEAKNPKAHEIVGCGAYSSYEGDLDVEKFKRMSFRVNWKASFDFPYMGMFLPPVDSDTEQWPRFNADSAGALRADDATYTSIEQMNAYNRKMHGYGFHVLSYFNITEFGTNIKGPDAVSPGADPKNLWRNANDFLFTAIPDGALRTEAGGFWKTWGAAIAMDPAGPKYQRFLLEQAQRHIDKLPDMDGICIDRLDWLRLSNPHEDDGVSWHNSKPCRCLYTSWRDIMAKLGPMMHTADKVIFVNNHLKRIDLLRDVDGIYCEFAHDGQALNSTAWLTVHKPAIGWTSSDKDLKPDPDVFFQQRLYLGVYPTAPFPGNDHTIPPSEWAEPFYLDYGPLFDAIRGKRWVLQPHVVEVQNRVAKANLFEVPGGFALPVVLGGDATTAHVLLRNLPLGKRNGNLKARFLHPGESEWKPLPPVHANRTLEIEVPLKRGCAMLMLDHK